MMDIEKIQVEKNGRATVLLKKCKPGTANALRRAMVELVPTMAIESVEFRDNSSVLYDEIVAHRLGLIPLTTDLSAYNLPENCECKGEGCARCQLSLTLKSDNPGVVSAANLNSKDPAVKPVYEDMPIVKLIKGQSIEFEAKACLGQGKDHAKFSPGLVWYRYKPTIKVDQSCSNKEDVKKSCPVNVFDIKGSKLEVVNESACHLCGACVDIAEGNTVTVEQTEGEFIMFIEPWGQLSALDMFTTACTMLDEEFGALESALKK